MLGWRLAWAPVLLVSVWLPAIVGDRSTVRGSADMRRVALTLILLPALGSASFAQHSAASVCAAKLSKDARAIYDATLPKLTPGANLRDVVTSTTRSLAMAGTISRGSARDSATAAGECLRVGS